MIICQENVVNLNVKEIRNIDAVVSSSNNYFKHGSGIASEVENLAGIEYKKSCDRLLRSREGIPVPVGSAHLMNAGGMRQFGIKYIINAVAMGYTDQKSVIPASKESVTQAVKSSLDQASSAGCETILFPVMCARHGGLTVKESTKWIMHACKHWGIYNRGTSLKKIIFNAYKDPQANYNPYVADYKSDFYEEWSEAHRLMVECVRASEYIKLIEMARDELMRCDCAMNFLVNGEVLRALDDAIFSKGYIKQD
jgi:O-acetyl-ADP-ribose deacetylase (regulator of RNase III)